VSFDIVEYIIMEWTMQNESQISRICRRVINKKMKSADGQFATVKYKSVINALLDSKT
jgi:hypothetical protein